MEKMEEWGCGWDYELGRGDCIGVGGCLFCEYVDIGEV